MSMKHKSSEFSCGMNVLIVLTSAENSNRNEPSDSLIVD